MQIRFWQHIHFKQYLERNWERLYRLAYAWCHHPQTAHDLLQETLSRTLREHHRFDNDKALDVWLYKVMANCWRDQYRRQQQLTELDEAELKSDSNPEADQYQREIQHKVHKAMARLSMMHRQIITLVDLEELAYHEVADILGIPTGTVMSRLSRARRQLKEYLQESGLQPPYKQPKLRRIK